MLRPEDEGPARGLRLEEAEAVLAEVWYLRSMAESRGFAVVVDSVNVAGWVSGRRSCRSGEMGGGRSERQEEVARVLETFEILIMHLGDAPLTTELVHWVPRECNRAADWLAGLALEEQEDRWYLHRSWRAHGEAALVLFSDAGVRRIGTGGWAGMGWVLVDRESSVVVAAAAWAREVDLAGGEADVNGWELRALEGGLGGLAAVRVGSVEHLARTTGRALTPTEVRSLKYRLRRGVRLGQ